MIVISFSEVASNKLELTVKGHSSNRKGEDIVCAAVSALTQTFVRGIEKNLKAEFKGKFQSGDCELLIEVPKESAKEFKIISEIFKEGFHKISESYPEQVKLN
ncbi:MAG: ribosomal-processing cysteine protease Prp [Candidatus Riflebacteria bacterium]|nr:ribosomal-processing cysteine protease Prp [Candidatus Riflebacteria bacterium]